MKQKYSQFKYLKYFKVSSIVSCFVAMLSLEAKAEGPPPIMKNATEQAPQDDGRLRLKDNSLSLVAPPGWTVRTDVQRLSLLIEAPKADGYQRNITVAKFNGEKFLSEKRASEFEHYLIENFSNSSPEVSNYQVRNYAEVQLLDGRKGILYYAEFQARGILMMQAHLLVSSETNHYLVSYTDLEKNFEKDGVSTPEWTEAWSTLVSLQLDSPSPVEKDFPFFIVAICAGALALLLGIRAFHKTYARAQYQEQAVELESDESGANLEPESHVSNLDSNVIPMKVQGQQHNLPGIPESVDPMFDSLYEDEDQPKKLKKGA
jgi:hypothetical protein